MFVEGLLDTLNGIGGIVLGHSRQNSNELIPGISNTSVGFTQVLVKEGGDLHQDPVPGLVAEFVVYFLEGLQIHHQKGNGLSQLRIAFEFPLHKDVKETQVGKPRQDVGESVLFRLLVDDGVSDGCGGGIGNGLHKAEMILVIIIRLV